MTSSGRQRQDYATMSACLHSCLFSWWGSLQDVSAELHSSDWIMCQIKVSGEHGLMFCVLAWSGGGGSAPEDPPSPSQSVYGGAWDCGWGALFLPRHHSGSIFHELTVTLGELTGRVSHCCDESFMLQRWNKLKNTAQQLHSLSSASTYFCIIYI